MMQFLGRRLIRSSGFPIFETTARSPCCLKLTKLSPRSIEDVASVYASRTKKLEKMGQQLKARNKQIDEGDDA